MFNLERWYEIYSVIMQHKLRTFLTALGVCWGMFMLVLLLGSSNGLLNGVTYEFRDDATNSIFIRPGWTAKSHQGLGKGRRVRFENRDYDMFKQTLPKIEYLTGRYYLSGEFYVRYKSKYSSYSIRAVHPDHRYLENTEIVKGRFLNELDMTQRRKVACIGKVVAKILFEEEEPIGKNIEIKGIRYKVVGIYKDSGGEREMKRIYLPVYTAQSIENSQNRLNMIILSVNGTIEDSKIVEKKAKNILAKNHNFDPEDNKAVRMWNNLENYQQFLSLFQYMRYAVWFVGIGTIIAGVIGVSNIMLIIVKERTKEIGIRRALGATSLSITTLIMQESVVITFLSGYLGLIFGLSLLYLVNSSGLELPFFRTPQVNFLVVFGALFILVLFGALAGLIPSLKAARIKPIEALRYEDG